MKKTIKLMLLVSLTGALMTSCVTASYMVTDNPVGKKVGIARMKVFSKDKDISLEKAAQNGGITKIGTVETRVTNYGIFIGIKTTVTGE